MKTTSAEKMAETWIIDPFKYALVKIDVRMFGCVLDGEAAEARAIELLQKTSDEKNSRVEGIDDDSEEDDDGLGGGVFINGLGGCERLLTIEPVKKTDSVLSSPFGLAY